MKSVKFFALLVAVSSTNAAAQTMNADLFHSRATKLAAKGPMALFARGEIKALMSEGQAAGLKAGENQRVTVAAGGKPRFCPPGKKVGMGSDEFMKRLGAIARAERARIDMTEATARIMQTKYPCPAS